MWMTLTLPVCLHAVECSRGLVAKKGILWVASTQSHGGSYRLQRRATCRAATPPPETMAYQPQNAQHAAMAPADAAGREAAAGAPAAATPAAAGTRRMGPPVQHCRTHWLASTEALAGLIGAVICVAFVLSPKVRRA
jgi:hypothetical protein